MPFVEADVKAKIVKLAKIVRLKTRAISEQIELNNLLDVLKTEAVAEIPVIPGDPDADPPIPDTPAVPAVPAIYDKPMDHGKIMSDAERERRAIFHLAEADKIIADALAI